MFSGRFSGGTPVFAARSTCHVGGRPVTSNHFSLPLLSVSAVPLHARLHTRGYAQAAAAAADAGLQKPSGVTQARN